MANIAASSLFFSSTQKDGRITVNEVHINSLGEKFSLSYLASSGTNLSTALALHATDMGVNLGWAEVSENVRRITLFGVSATPSLQYSVLSETIVAAREAYKTATRYDAVMLGDYLNTRSNAQLQGPFSMTSAQVATMKTGRLTPASSLAFTIRSLVGQ